MLEKVYQFTETDQKIIERIVDDGEINLNHVVLEPHESLPEHVSNANVYLVIVRGILSAQYGEQDVKGFPQGTIVNVPFNTKMNLKNEEAAVLEFFIFKSPHPDKMRNGSIT